jgi:hypothetical protein
MRGLAVAGGKEMDDLYQEYGVDKLDLPKWMQNAIPVETDPETGEITMWNPSGINPFNTVDSLGLSLLSPPIKIVIERALGEDIFRKKPFTSPTTIQAGTGNMKFNTQTQRFEPVKVVPGLAQHFLSQVPQYGLLQAWTTPARQYSTGTLWNPQPIMKKGRPAAPLQPGREAAKMLGYSTFGYQPRDEKETGQQNKRMLTMLLTKLQGNQPAEGGLR